jgi:hypothetical protein
MNEQEKTIVIALLDALWENLPNDYGIEEELRNAEALVGWTPDGYDARHPRTTT